MIKPIPNKIVPIDDEIAYMELVADEENDLTDLTSVDGFNIAFGSLCLVIETGEFWAFNSSNTWVNQSGGNSIEREVSISTSGDVTQALEAGVNYHFTGNITSLTVTLAPTTGRQQYAFDFISGATAATVSIPNTVTMPDAFSVEANKRYEIDIFNGYGAAQSWTVTQS